MSQLAAALDILDEFTSLPNDTDLIREKTGQVAETLKASFDRTTDATRALELIACEDYIGEVPEWIDPTPFVECGYLVEDEAFGETTLELTVPGRQFIRKALVDLHEANPRGVAPSKSTSKGETV